MKIIAAILLVLTSVVAQAETETEQAAVSRTGPRRFRRRSRSVFSGGTVRVRTA